MLLSRGVITLLGLVITTALVLGRPAPLADLDLRVFDAFVRADEADPTPAVHTAVVAIDDASLARLGQWPWPRAVLATLVDRLREDGARVIGFDVLFAEPDRTDPLGDRQLANALARTASVTGFALVFDDAAPSNPCGVPPLELVERQHGDRSPSAGLFDAASATCTLDSLTAAAGAAGFINAAPDADGLLRRVPLLVRWNGRAYPSLALAVTRRAIGGSVLLEAADDGAMQLSVGPTTTALDARGRLLVRHAHRVGARAPISAADVVDGTADPERIRGRVVFVGATALGLQDVAATARDRALAGVELHAAIADSLLSGTGYARPVLAPLLEVSSAIAAVLFVMAATAWRGLLAGAGIGAGLALFGWWMGGAALESQGWFVSPLWLMAAVAVTLALEGGATALRERRRADRERRRRADAQRLLVQALTTLTETRDAATGQHARRTQEYTRLLAEALAAHPDHRDDLTPERVTLLATLAPLHDIGKVGVPDAVLRKPGALTPDELAEMRRHPELGHESLLRAEALAGVYDDEVVALAKEVVHTHHERWDGTGYPRGLRGSAIPLAGRIVALVDAYDAMVTTRSYRGGVTHLAAVEAIKDARGQHFDPDVVEAFLAVHDRFREAAGLR